VKSCPDSHSITAQIHENEGPLRIVRATNLFRATRRISSMHPNIVEFFPMPIRGGGVHTVALEGIAAEGSKFYLD